MTWKDEVFDALINLGGEADLKTIQEYIRLNSKRVLSRSWEKSINSIIVTHSTHCVDAKEVIFYSTSGYRSARWGIVKSQLPQDYKLNLQIEQKFKNSIEDYSKGQIVNYPWYAYSWALLSPEIAVKEVDRSCFIHHGTAIPRNITYFFNTTGYEKKDTFLIHDGQIYDAYFSADEQDSFRTRLYWKSDFSRLLIEKFPDWYAVFLKRKPISSIRPKIRFRKIEDSIEGYEIEFIYLNEIDLDSIIDAEESVPHKTEGGVAYFYSKKYERNPMNRKNAIEIHGTKCTVCEFDFEKTYGVRGIGFIEIHHTKPLYLLDDEIVINPYTDLVPVCSNCHKMIHRRKDSVLSIEELRLLICKR